MFSERKMPAIEVQCFRGYNFNDRPISFILNEKKQVVEKIIDEWCGQGCAYYKVLADDTKGYLLIRHENRGDWALKRVLSY
jgi:uncharacterized protein YutD